MPIWLGIPFLGALLGEHFTYGPRLFVFIAAMVFAMAHILLLNDWGDLIKNPLERSRYTQVSNIEVFKFGLWVGAVLSFVISVGLYAGLVSFWVLLSFYFMGGSFSILYSHPKIHFKESVVGSTALHFWGGLLQFMLGYLAFSQRWQDGILWGVFFSLVFVAGHLVHECVDVDEDRRGALRRGQPGLASCRC